MLLLEDDLKMQFTGPAIFGGESMKENVPTKDAFFFLPSSFFLLLHLLLSSSFFLLLFFWLFISFSFFCWLLRAMMPCVLCRVCNQRMWSGHCRAPGRWKPKWKETLARCTRKVPTKHRLVCGLQMRHDGRLTERAKKAAAMIPILQTAMTTDATLNNRIDLRGRRRCYNIYIHSYI